MNPNQNPFKFTPPPEEDLPECEERAYWHKRFNFASWLFLFFAFWAIFTSSTATSAIIAITTSIDFQLADSICQTRHIMWHMRRNGSDHDLR